MSTIVPCLLLSLIDCKVCYETISLENIQTVAQAHISCMFGVSRRDVVIYVEILLCCFFGFCTESCNNFEWAPQS
jgi:hypothetical protein